MDSKGYTSAFEKDSSNPDLVGETKRERKLSNRHPQKPTVKAVTQTTTIMATEDAVGIQTRAMTEAQRTKNGAQQIVDNNQEGGQRAAQDTGEIAQDPAMNPVVEIHKNDDVIIEEYIQCQGGIGLDWYVPDFKNTQVKTLIRERVKCTTQRGRILFTCPSIKRILSHINI